MSSRLEPAALLVAPPSPGREWNPLMTCLIGTRTSTLIECWIQETSAARVTIAGRRMWEDLHMVFVVDVDACRRGWIVVRLAGIAFCPAGIHGQGRGSQPRGRRGCE